MRGGENEFHVLSAGHLNEIGEKAKSFMTKKQEESATEKVVK